MKIFYLIICLCYSISSYANYETTLMKEQFQKGEQVVVCSPQDRINRAIIDITGSEKFTIQMLSISQSNMNDVRINKNACVVVKKN